MFFSQNSSTKAKIKISSSPAHSQDVVCLNKLRVHTSVSSDSQLYKRHLRSEDYYIKSETRNQF